MGVPTLACECAVCTSPDPHDRRLRPSVLLRWTEPSTETERIVVIDTGPDFREQALRARLTHVDIMGARTTIDLLGILAEKTKGNLTPAEDRMLQTVLFEARMAFLEPTSMMSAPSVPPPPPAKK